jgi:hypothetical protein
MRGLDVVKARIALDRAPVVFVDTVHAEAKINKKEESR